MSGECAVDVLIPTRDRPCALAVTLATLASQGWRRMRIIISDQSDGPGPFVQGEIQTLIRYLRLGGIELLALRHLPRRGMAEQRAFLLAQAEAPYCLFLDDDVIVEPSLVERMLAAIREQGCGFVGSALHGLSYANERRHHQEDIEFWNTQVAPEAVQPDTPEWARHHLHSAANLLHVQQRLGVPDGQSRLYRVAWVGGCVMFDTERLRACGGFDFWRDLPLEHCGEDVEAQLRVMARHGGCGLLPSGAYHLELPTTICAREVDAPRVLRT